MSILTLIFLTNMFLLLCLIIKTESSPLIKYFNYIIILLFLMSSQYDPMRNSGFFSPEQEGHALEFNYWIDEKCSINYSIYEPFKTLAMYLACVMNLEWMFDLIFRVVFVVVFIFTLNKIKAINLNLRLVSLCRNIYSVITFSLIPVIIYGGPRQALASLILISSFVLYRESFSKGVIFSILSSFPHSVGLLSPIVIIAIKTAKNYQTANFKQKLIILFFIFLLIGILLISLMSLTSAFLSGQSEYIGNKNAAAYVIMESGNTETLFGLPRSFFFIPGIFLLSVTIYNKQNAIIYKTEGLVLWILMCILVALGSLVSPQVAGRFIGFLVPLMTYISVVTLLSNKGVLKKIVGWTLLIYINIRSFFDGYQMSIANLKDFFGLPYIYSNIEIYLN
jgi:hypothetical protein